MGRERDAAGAREDVEASGRRAGIRRSSSSSRTRRPSRAPAPARSCRAPPPRSARSAASRRPCATTRSRRSEGRRGSGIGPFTPEQQAVALALGVTVAAGSTVPAKSLLVDKTDKSGADLGKVEPLLRPRCAQTVERPGPQGGGRSAHRRGPGRGGAAGAASSSSAAAASAPLNAAASGNAPASADVKPERKRRGKPAKASSATPGVIALRRRAAPGRAAAVEHGRRADRPHVGCARPAGALSVCMRNNVAIRHWLLGRAVSSRQPRRAAPLSRARPPVHGTQTARTAPPGGR